MTQSLYRMHQLIFTATVKKKEREMQLSYFQQVHLLEPCFICFAESKPVWGRLGAITPQWSVLIHWHNVLQVYMPAEVLCQCLFLPQQCLSDTLWVELINIFYYHHFVLPLSHKLQNNWHLCNFQGHCLSFLHKWAYVCVCACVPVFLTINEHVAAFASGYALDSYVSDSAGACLCAELSVCVCMLC